MTALATFFKADPETALALAGLFIGLAFGAAAMLSNFCVMGALSDVRASGSAERLAAVALAAAVAIAGTQLLAANGLTDLTRSMYLAPRINWLGATAGGLLFGAGMVYAGGCASRNLVRAGAGDLRSLFVLLTLSLAAYATISGVLGPLRALLEDATAVATAPGQPVPSPAFDGWLMAAGFDGSMARGLSAFALIVPLAAFATRRGSWRGTTLAGGAASGLLVVAGWLVTGLAYDEMALRPAPPASLSFVRPVADAFDWLQRSTALGLPGFGAASIFGTALGSALAAAARGRFRVQAFTSSADMIRHFFGALAMGAGGVLALGCSIGQGLTGLSTLSVQSLLATLSILAGAWLALARLERDL